MERTVETPAEKEAASRTASGSPGEAPAGWESRALSRPAQAGDADLDLDADIDPGELEEFLAADVMGASADPVFKERLREKLWRVVTQQYGSPPAAPRRAAGQRAARRDEDEG